MKNIYFLFGKTGSGKSFLGNYLQNHYNFVHFDADILLTSTMKNFIIRQKTFSQEMVDEYSDLLIEKINFYHQSPHQSVVISQGLYRNKNRLDILKIHPYIQFILMSAEEQICYQRILERKNEVSIEYAKKISPLFEAPEGFDFKQINNNTDDSLHLQLHHLQIIHA